MKLSLEQALVLVAISASVAATVILAPAHFWDKLADASPEVVAAWVLTVGSAVVAVFVRPKPLPPSDELFPDTPTKAQGPRALRRRDRQPGDDR